MIFISKIFYGVPVYFLLFLFFFFRKIELKSFVTLFILHIWNLKFLGELKYRLFMILCSQFDDKKRFHLHKAFYENLLLFLKRKFKKLEFFFSFFCVCRFYMYRYQFVINRYILFYVWYMYWQWVVNITNIKSSHIPCSFDISVDASM